MVHPRIGTEAVTVNYSISPTTFLEATYGRAGNQLAACGPTPSFCNQTAVPVNDISNLNNAGLSGLPLLFPEASVLNKDYYAYSILTEASVPFFDGNRILRAPNFSWGNRVVAANNNQGAPPNINFPGFLNINTTQDVVISLTKVKGSHTFKTGFYNSHSLKRENNVQGAADNFGTLSFANDTVGTNPFDTSFGFANAAIGSFSSYAQASRYVEGTFKYNNIEGYVQDNWKVNNQLTLDYGVRFVHAQPQHDSLLQSGNFLPDKWSQADAPMLYVAGCANGVYPCTGTNRQAMNPLTGQFLGPNSTLAIGTLVPNSGNLTNGLFQSGEGIAKTTYTFPKLNVGPRFGMAYDVNGKQRVVLRGAVGVYFDRPRPGDAQALVGNPPGGSRIITVRYGQLQSLSSGGLTHDQPARESRCSSTTPSCRRRCSSAAARRCMLPWATSMDLSYVGLHSWNDQQPWNINSIDLGSAFLSTTQDPTLAASTDRGRHLLRGDESGSGARLSRLQLDGQHEPLLRRMADLPLHPALVQPPVQGRAAVRLQRHHHAVGRGARRAALRSHGRRSVRAPGRRGAGAGAARQSDAPHPHHEGHGGLGSSRHPEQQYVLEGDRADRQRLAAVDRLDGVDRRPRRRSRRLHRQRFVPERRRQREPHRVARLRTAHSSSSAILARGAAAIRTGNSTPPRSRDQSSAASGSSRATTISTAASRTCWICRLRETSVSAAGGCCSSGPTCSTHPTRRRSPAATRRST